MLKLLLALACGGLIDGAQAAPRAPDLPRQAGTWPDLCAENLMINAPKDVSQLATRLNAWLKNSAHRLVIDAGSGHSDVERILYYQSLSERGPLQVWLYQAPNALYADRVELDLRPLAIGPIELALKVWPGEVERDKQTEYVEPLQLAGGQGIRLKQLIEQVRAGRLVAFKNDPHLSLRLSVDLQLTDEAKRYAQRSRYAWSLRLQSRYVRELREKLGLSQALNEVRLRFKNPNIQIQSVEVRQNYGPERFTIGFFPELSVPEGLDALAVTAIFYKALADHLATTPADHAPKPLFSRINHLRRISDVYRTWVSFNRYDAAEAEWAPTKQKLMLPSPFGPVWLNVYANEGHTP